MLKTKGKIKTQGIIIIIVVVLVGTSIGIFGWWYRNNYVPNIEKMIITSDEDFSLIYNLPGNGTKDNPYRIENIQQRGTHRIEISETTKYFAIQNCELKNLWGEVIVISDVADGTALICNNTFTEESYLFYYFIKLISADNSSIINNNFINDVGHIGMNGISIANSLKTSITDNYFLNLKYCITTNYSHLSNISRNRFETNRQGITNYSMRLVNSNNLSIVKNSMKKMHIGIHCVTANNLVIQNNSLNFCNYSIILSRTSYSIISQNVVNNSYREGISFGSADYCKIYNNTIGYGIFDGVLMDNCHFNNFTYNSFLDNEGQAASFWGCYNNTLWHNNFIDNNPNGTIHFTSVYYNQAFDTGNNDWFNINLTMGNFWSDLSWNMTATYTIDSGSNVNSTP